MMYQKTIALVKYFIFEPPFMGAEGQRPGAKKIRAGGILGDFRPACPSAGGAAFPAMAAIFPPPRLSPSNTQ